LSDAEYNEVVARRAADAKFIKFIKPAFGFKLGHGRFANCPGGRLFKTTKFKPWL
jgi:hypothetical protein